MPYLSNFYFIQRGAWEGPADVFWSLAVEEQFYIVWPWLMLFLPRRLLLPAIVTAIMGAISYRLAGVVLGWRTLTITLFPLANADALGVGALLAYSRICFPTAYRKIAGSKWYTGAAALASTVVFGLSVWTTSAANPILGPFLTAALFAWIVHKASLGVSGLPGRLLENRATCYLGVISYELYIYHCFVQTLGLQLFKALQWNAAMTPLMQLLLFTPATVAVAALSWRLFERPINLLKRHFSYTAKA